MKKNKTLIMDLETSPNISYTWGLYEQNVVGVKEEWYMMSFAYKWLGEKTTKVKALPDYDSYKKDSRNDKKLVQDLWELMDEADVVMAHNGDKFDIRKANARFITHGLTPPSPYKTIDTLKVARKYFKFDSNRLDDLGEYLDVGRKVSTGGFKLWLDCMAGDMKAWNKMKKYNKVDVELLERVYLKLRGWIQNHPSCSLLSGELHTCPNCQSTEVQRRGYAYKKTRRYQRFQCKACSAWSQATKAVVEEKPLYTN